MGDFIPIAGVVGAGDYSSMPPRVRSATGERDRDRSRSRSRDRDGHRRRHSKKHRRRRSRSRSRSRSRDRGHRGKVHVNPLFSGLGPSATSLLQENTRLEEEVTRLRQEVACTLARVNPLENELRNTVQARARAEGQLSIQLIERRKVEAKVSDMTKSIQRLERTLAGVRSDLVRANSEREKGFERVKGAEMERDSMKEQSAFLAKRNEVLGKKCEELLEKNRLVREECEEAYRAAESVRREMDNLRADTDMKLADFRRLQNELSTAREKEKIWKAEIAEMGRLVEAKESLVKFERRQAETQKKRDREQVERLEQKLKSSGSGWETQLGIESVFRAIEVVKEEFGSQLTHLKGQMDPLLEKSSEGVSFRPLNMTGIQQPPRVQSAPAAPVPHAQPGTEGTGNRPVAMEADSIPPTSNPAVNNSSANGTTVQNSQLPSQNTNTSSSVQPNGNSAESVMVMEVVEGKVKQEVLTESDEKEEKANCDEKSTVTCAQVKSELLSDADDLFLDEPDPMNGCPQDDAILDEDALLGPA